MFDRTLFHTLARRTRLDLPVVPLPILDDQQPILLVFDQRDLALELAYERHPQPGGTRVRSVTQTSTLYWIPRMTPVSAVLEGVVVYARHHADGHTIVIDHETGWGSVYHRLAHMFVTPSERQPGRETRVRSGDVLGYLGASIVGPLKPLRFELWKNDGTDDCERVDPLRYIRQWGHIGWRDSRDFMGGICAADAAGEG